MRDYKLYLEGAEVGRDHEPFKFDTIVKAINEHHAREIARRVYGYFTLVLVVDMLNPSGAADV